MLSTIEKALTIHQRHDRSTALNYHLDMPECCPRATQSFVEHWTKRLGADLILQAHPFGGPACCDTHASNAIWINQDAFGSKPFACVLAHEIGHWSGRHVGRKSYYTGFDRAFFTPEYIREEQVAELTAYMLCTTMGLACDAWFSTGFLVGTPLMDISIGQSIEATRYLLTL